MRRTAAILMLAAMTAGIAGGLIYTWGLDPIEEYESSPDALRSQDKQAYLVLVGDLYAYEGDLTQAKARLVELGIEADGQVLAGLLEEYLDGGGRPEEVRNLARLAEALGASGGVLLVFASVATLSPEPEPTTPPQPGVSPTPAPSVTPAPSFRLTEQTAVCAPAGQPGLIGIWVRDAAGQEMAGMELVVSWNTGQDRLFTGLRPEQGVGYADFQMEPRIEYEVALANFKGDTAQGLASDLSAGVCPTGTTALSWRLTFEQAQ